MIKILIAPNFEQDDENDQPKDVMELELVGHKAIVRTVCFNPVDPTILLSGGLLESNVKVWDTESGSNIANLLLGYALLQVWLPGYLNFFVFQLLVSSNISLSTLLLISNIHLLELFNTILSSILTSCWNFIWDKAW